MLNPAQICARHAKLVIEDQQGWYKGREDVYRFVMPFRRPPLTAGGMSTNDKAPPSTTDIWDATAVVACQRGAGRIQRALTPDYEDWIGLGPGPMVPDEHRDKWGRDLDRCTKVARGILDQGGFGLAAGEFFQDLYAGEACLLALKGDEEELVKFAAIPPELVQTVEDSFGKIKIWIYQKRMAGEDILRDWPKATLPKDLDKIIRKDGTIEHDVMISCERIKRGQFEFKVIWKKDASELWRETMRTSPFITPRFFKAPGQRRGLGVPMLAMPTIKTVNKAVEFELKAAAFAILGVWMTTDDGVYNPRTSVLSPGGMLKVSSTGGPRGASMARLPIPDNFDLSRIVTQELRIQIREMLYDDDMPYQGGPVRSPTEIVERLKRLVQHIAGAFGRLFAELIVPLVQRVLDIADQFALLPVYPNIDNLLTKAQVLSPLANAQMLEDVEKTIRWIELVAALFGPREAEVQADPDKVGPYLREKLGADIKLQRDDDERKSIREQLRVLTNEAYQAEAQKAAQDEVKKATGTQAQGARKAA